MRCSGYILVIDQNPSTIRIFWNRQGSWGQYHGDQWVCPFQRIDIGGKVQVPLLSVEDAVAKLQKVYQRERVIAVVSPLDVMERLFRDRRWDELKHFVSRF